MLVKEELEGGLETLIEVEQPRLGFLGVGWIGRHRMEATVRAGVARVAAIADPVQELVEGVRSIVPQAEVVEGLDALLEMDLDGLVIATPSALHADQCVRALEAGLPVFCQKPLGRNTEETQKVVEAAQKQNLLLGVDFSYRYIRGVQQMRDLIQAGALGRIFAVNLVFHNAYGPNKSWFYDARLSGGGCVVDLGIHLVDLAHWMLGVNNLAVTGSSLFAGGEPLLDRHTVEDFADARMQLDGGATLSLTCSWHLHAGQDAVIEASFYGTEGGLSLQNVNGSFFDFTVTRFKGTSREVLASPPDEWGGRAVVDWAERLARNPHFDAGAWSVVDVARTLDAVYHEAGVLSV